MRSLATALACLLCAVAALAPARAGAQGAHTGGGSHTGGGTATPPPPRDTFSEAYTAASRAWHEGRYEDALSQFRALYRSSDRHELLYDIGVTADRLGRLEESIEAFEQYLAHVPAARNRAEVEHRIASLREDLRERDHVATAPPERTTAPRTERPVMTLSGPVAGTTAPASSGAASGPPPGAIAGFRPGGSSGPSDDALITTGGGPEWVWTWPLLVLTLGASIAAPIAWDQGWQALARLEATCTAQGGCTDDEIESSAPKNWELATNVLFVSALALGGITVIVFLAEGLSGGPTVVRRAERREGVRLRVGLGGLGLEGAF